MKKLICVVGVTGNQGGSVAKRFADDPNYRVRGLTRDPDSTVAQKLAAKGIEIVKADLDDVKTLVPAFAGANIIFSVTNYWEPFFRPDCRARAAEQSISCRKYAYYHEYEQGKNIADAAAATINSLDSNGFIVSTLSHGKKCSNGKFEELYHYDGKADIFPFYVKDRYPELAKKMSCVQTGFFNSSYKLIPEAYLRKMSNGSFLMTFPCAPDVPIPHLAVNADLGNFVYAVSKMPAGKSYIAAGTFCSWSEYMRIWSRVTGAPTSYKQITSKEFIELTRDKEFGREAADMFEYSSEPGYDGGDKTLLKAGDIQAAGIECPMTTLENWMRQEDWSPVLTA